MTVTEFKQLIASLQQKIIVEQANLKENNKENQSLNQLQEKINTMSAYFDQMISEGKIYTNIENAEVLDHLSEIRNDMRALDEGVSANFKTSFEADFGNVERTVSALDPSKNVKFTDCLDNSELTVTLRPNQIPNFMGNVSSKRYMINVNGQDGFFTIDQKLLVYDQDGTIKTMVEDSMKNAVIASGDVPNPEFAKDIPLEILQDSFELSREENPEDLENPEEPEKPEEAPSTVEDTTMKEFCNMLLEGNNLSNLLLSMKLRAQSRLRDDEPFDNVSQAFDANIMTEFGLDIENNPYHSVEKLINGNKNIKDLLLKIRNSFTEDAVSRLLTDSSQFSAVADTGIHGEQGSSISGRSVATSRINTLLGVPDISARAVPMTVQWNNQTFHGVFMEKAKGHVLPEEAFAAESPMFFALYDKNGLKTKDPFRGEGLKSISDQIIVDYICQNVDRHQGNMLYNFDENGKFIGSQGIDNDLSFGTRVIGDNEQIQNAVTLNNIQTISSSMKARVEKLSRETLAASLKDTGLTEKEIIAACDRLDHLKEHLRENLLTKEPEKGEKKIQYGKVRLIEDGKWDEYTVDDFQIHGQEDDFSPFRNLEIIRGEMADAHKTAIKEGYFDKRPEPDASKPFKKTKERNELSREKLAEKQKEFKKYADLFKKTEIRHGSKKQYDEMQKALKQMLKYDHTKELTIEQIHQYNDDRVKLEKAVEAYIAYKEPRNDTGIVATDRLKHAKALNEMLGKDKEFYLESFRKAEEKYLEKAHNEYVKERREANVKYTIDTIAKKISEMPRHRKADKEVVYALVKLSNIVPDILKSMNNDDAALAQKTADHPEEVFAIFKERLKDHKEAHMRIDLDKATFKTKKEVKREIEAAKKAKADEEKKAAKTTKKARTTDKTQRTL